MKNRLEARFLLDSGMRDRIDSADILYDRDKQCEYFQLYSRAVGKRVFFEVVQRCDCDAYCAANAAIRLGAQADHRDPGWM